MQGARKHTEVADQSSMEYGSALLPDAVGQAEAASSPDSTGSQAAAGAPRREHLRDLAALLALPRMWRGLQPNAIASSLLDVLVSLLRLDVAHIRIARSEDVTVFQDCRPVPEPSAEELDALRRATTAQPSGIATVSLGSRQLRVMRLTPHADGERVTVLVAATRRDFPTEFESFLCRVAVEQAMLAFHSARLLEGLRTANAAKATFLATMSHELRTPLNAIVGYSALLHTEIHGSLHERQKQHVTRIESAARHLIELIEGILSFARVEAGRERVYLQEMRVAEIVGDVVALIEPLAKSKSLEMSVRVHDPELRIVSDSAKVRQILLNLLSNAVKFTAAGEVGLEVRRDDESVLLIVTDTGVGVAPENRERIFEPFHQAGDTHASRGPGTGLGLSVSRQLARLLGGDVTLESWPGAGSTFVARLPVLSIETPEEAQSTAPAAERSAH